MFMKTFLLAFFISIPGLLKAQNLFRDSLLANERSIDRPITLHAGQVRVTGGYGLSIISRRFDNDGKIIKLRDEGLSSVRHRMALDIKYGLNDFIQLNVAIARSGTVLREQTRYIFSNDTDPVIMHDVVKEYSGMEDLYAGIDLRAPFKTRKVDLSVTLGSYFPVAPFEPEKPGHTYEALQEQDTRTDKFTYRYYYPMGKGVAVVHAGGMIKYRTPKWAFSARMDYQHGMKDGKSFDWVHQLTTDDSFEYREIPFAFRLPDSFNYLAEVEYQPLPWFDIFVDLSWYVSWRGWTSSGDELKVALPEQSQIMLAPGFEIIVTPRFWLRERLNFSLAGENYEAPFGFQTSLIYNFFPF